MVNGYCSSKREFNTLLQYVPKKAYIKVNNIHNIEYREKWELKTKSIDEYVLVYVRSGNGYYIINGERIDFLQGSVILISPMSYFSAQGGTSVPSLYSVRLQIVGQSKETVLFLHKDLFYLHYHDDNLKYKELFEKLYAAYIKTNNQNIKTTLCNAITSGIFCNLWKDINHYSKCFDMQLNKAKVYIEKNPLKKHTIDKLSEIAGLSKSYFSKKFKKHYGISPKSYIHQVKMQYAKNLLYEYSYKVKEVAYLVGYSDPYIFSNQFKKVFGISPSSIIKKNNH